MKRSSNTGKPSVPIVTPASAEVAQAMDQIGAGQRAQSVAAAEASARVSGRQPAVTVANPQHRDGAK